jgi:low affinity Fe/Cu permease
MAIKQQSREGTRFTRFATQSAGVVGTPWAFTAALASVVIWLILGPHFGFSDAWQLVMNSWSNIITFLMVFLIQNSQNRDSKAINLKLDEVIRATQRAENEMIDIEKLSDRQLEELAKRYERIRRESDEKRQRGSGELGVTEKT